MSRILALAHKEALQIRRDPILPRLIISLPIAMMLLFGYAINFTLTGVKVVVYDASQDRISQAMVQELVKDNRFVIAVQAQSRLQVTQAIDQNQARIGVVIPAGALQAVRQNQTLALEVFVDGTDPNFAFQAQANLRKAFTDVNSRILAGRALTGDAITPPITPSLTTLYNPDNKTAWFMIPGIIGLIMTQFTVLLTALSIVRESEARMLESLLSSPVRSYEVVLGKVIPYLVIASLVSLIILAIGHWVFEVPVRGSVGLLFVLILLFVLGSLGVGVLISTLARTQVQAVFGTFAYSFPTIFLSGFVFPLEGMPWFFQSVSYLIPARYLIDGLRGVLLKGVGLETLWLDLLALVVFSGGVLVLASWRFGRKLAA